MIHTFFFANELKNNLNLYLDSSCNTINLTTLAECYINQYNVATESEEEVFEAVIDWFDSWSGRFKFNN